MTNAPQNIPHVCLSGSLWCSGCNPCPPCRELVDQTVQVTAMMSAGFNGSPAQAQAYADGLDRGWNQLHARMHQDAALRARVIATDVGQRSAPQAPPWAPIPQAAPPPAQYAQPQYAQPQYAPSPPQQYAPPLQYAPQPQYGPPPQLQPQYAPYAQPPQAAPFQPPPPYGPPQERYAPFDAPPEQPSQQRQAAVPLVNIFAAAQQAAAEEAAFRQTQGQPQPQPDPQPQGPTEFAHGRKAAMIARPPVVMSGPSPSPSPSPSPFAPPPMVQQQESALVSVPMPAGVASAPAPTESQSQIADSDMSRLRAMAQPMTANEISMGGALLEPGGAISPFDAPNGAGKA